MGDTPEDRADDIQAELDAGRDAFLPPGTHAISRPISVPPGYMIAGWPFGE